MNHPLITFEQFAEYFELSEYMAENPKVNHSIIQAQDKYIKPIVGRKLFEEILDGQHAALFPFIHKALAYYAGVELMTMNGAQLTPSGMATFATDWTTSAPVQLINQKANLLNASGQAAIEDLRHFLNENRASYPSYDDFLRQLSSSKGGWA